MRIALYTNINLKIEIRRSQNPLYDFGFELEAVLIKTGLIKHYIFNC